MRSKKFYNKFQYIVPDHKYTTFYNFFVPVHKNQLQNEDWTAATAKVNFYIIVQKNHRMEYFYNQGRYIEIYQTKLPFTPHIRILQCHTLLIVKYIDFIL